MGLNYYVATSPLTSKEISSRTDNFFGGNNVITEVDMTVAGDGTVILGHFILSNNGMVIENYSSVVSYNPTDYVGDFYIVAYCGSPVNIAFDGTTLDPHPNDKTNDDYVDFYATKTVSSNETLIATKHLTDWTSEKAIGIATSSEKIYAHIRNLYVGSHHFTQNSMDALTSSGATVSNKIVSMNEVGALSPDFGDANKIELIPLIYNLIGATNITHVSNLISSSIKFDAIRSGYINQDHNGVIGLINGTSSSAKKGFCHYYNDTGSDKTVITLNLLDAAGNIDSLIVNAVYKKSWSGESDTTYDAIITDATGDYVASGLVFNEIYPGYTIGDKYATGLKLVFHLPAVYGGDNYVTLTDHPLARKCYRGLSNENGHIFSFAQHNPLNTYKQNLHRYLYNSMVWTELAACTSTSIGSCPVSVSGGIIKSGNPGWLANTAAGHERYSSSSNTWRSLVSTITGGNYGSLTYGTIELDNETFYHSWPGSHVRVHGISTTYTSLTAYNTTRLGGGTFKSINQHYWVFGGYDSIPAPSKQLTKYSLQNGTWSNYNTGLQETLVFAYASMSYGHGIAIGGWVINGSTLTKANQQFNENNNAWTSGMEYPTYIYDCAAARTNDDGIMIWHGSTAAPTNATFVKTARLYTPLVSNKFYGFAAMIRQ